jgi:hypothetical protein
MAKEDMLCPFSGKLCRECPLYRGRHYYLCFSKKYRGRLEKPGENANEANPGTSEAEYDEHFKPLTKMPSAVDPFKTPLFDIWD